MRHKLTAIIYDKRGRVLSVGQNSYVKTHPLQVKYAREVGSPAKEFLHAEISAIVKCEKLDKAVRIVVYRYGRDGKSRNARPCEVCQKAISEAGITEVEYTV